MSAESIFLINPRRKKRRKGRMPAGLARYWASRRGGKKRRRARAVMTNPRRRHRRRNPHHRRARRRNPIVHAYKRRRARHRNPIFRRRRARHRNPFTMGGLKSVLVPAAIGAGGAIALAVAYGYAAPKLPASLATGYFPAIVKIAGAIGLGMLAGKFLGREQGKYVTLGGLTVVLVGVITPMIAQAVPTLGLSGLSGDYIPYRPMGAYMKNPGMGRLGFYSPAAVIGAGGVPAAPGTFGAYMGPGRAAPAPLSDLTGSNYQWQNDGM